MLAVLTITAVALTTAGKPKTNQDLKLGSQTDKIEPETNNLDQLSGNSNQNTQQDSNSLPTTPPQPTMNSKKISKPEMIIDTAKNYTAVISTNLGEIKIRLYADDTPLTVNNFVYLAKNDFYNDVIFHRVIKDFMIQGGDPTGTGRGGPGYKFADENSSHSLVKGSVAMANSGPNTNGSQFFIVTADSTPWLDGKHTNFGEVIAGMDVVEKIEQTQTGAQDRPLEPIVIENIEIIEE